MLARGRLADADRAGGGRRRCPARLDLDQQAQAGGVPDERERAIGHGDTSHRNIRLAHGIVRVPTLKAMILRPYLYEPTACASYLFGCLSKSQLAVVDPHVELVDAYLTEAERVGAPIVAVFETHVQADHVSGLPALVEATGATAYLPAGADVEFAHAPLADGETVELGNTVVRALATPGHAPAHHAYVVADRRRGDEEPWLVFTGDSLLVGDVGRPDLHAGGDPEPLARQLHGSIGRLLELPDRVLVYPSHFGGSVCGRASPATRSRRSGSSARTTRRSRTATRTSFARALLVDVPPPPAGPGGDCRRQPAGRIAVEA